MISMRRTINDAMQYDVMIDECDREIVGLHAHGLGLSVMMLIDAGAMISTSLASQLRRRTEISGDCDAMQFFVRVGLCDVCMRLCIHSMPAYVYTHIYSHATRTHARIHTYTRHVCVSMCNDAYDLA